MENADSIRRGRGGAEIQHPNFIDSRAHLWKSSNVGTSGAKHSKASKF